MIFRQFGEISLQSLYNLAKISDCLKPSSTLYYAPDFVSESFGVLEFSALFVILIVEFFPYFHEQEYEPLHAHLQIQFWYGAITTNIKIQTINGRFFYFIHALLYNTFSGYGCCNIFEILWTIGSNTSFITNSYQFIFTLLNKLLMFR